MKKQRKPLKNFPKAIGFVHWGVAICVIGAIISSLFVDISDPDSDLSIIIHVRIGYGVAFFLLCQWFLLSFKRYKPVREHVFPYHLEGRKCIAADLCLLMQGKLPPTGCRSGASGLVEGLGILLLTWMAPLVSSFTLELSMALIKRLSCSSSGTFTTFFLFLFGFL